MATSKLQILTGNLLDKELPQYRIRENYRPDWLLSSNLTKLELDFYIEELNVGIEVQGMQHYVFIPFFYKSQDEFEKRKMYDQEKRDLCEGKGVKLIEICSEMDIILFIKDIKESLKSSTNTIKYVYTLISNPSKQPLKKAPYEYPLRDGMVKDKLESELPRAKTRDVLSDKRVDLLNRETAEATVLLGERIYESPVILNWFTENKSEVEKYIEKAEQTMIAICSMLDNFSPDKKKRPANHIRAMLKRDFPSSLWFDKVFIKETIYKWIARTQSTSNDLRVEVDF